MALARNLPPLDASHPPAPPRQDSRPSGWLGILAVLLYAFLSFTVGLILIFSPWLNLWEHNYFAGWGELWSNSYIRGAVSGLGLINLGISLGELARLFRRRSS